MADLPTREMSNKLSSGEITQIKIGGSASGDIVPTFDDLTATNTSFDDTGLGISAANAQLALAALAEVGLVVMSGTDLTPQAIGTSATKVILYDTKVVEAGVGVEGDVANNKATVTIGGIFKVRFGAFVSYASNIDITWQLYKNGSPSGNEITLSGQGATVFQIILLTSVPLLENDYLELFATASSSTDITMAATNGTIEKTIF